MQTGSLRNSNLSKLCSQLRQWLMCPAITNVPFVCPFVCPDWGVCVTKSFQIVQSTPAITNVPFVCLPNVPFVCLQIVQSTPAITNVPFVCLCPLCVAVPLFARQLRMSPLFAPTCCPIRLSYTGSTSFTGSLGSSWVNKSSLPDQVQPLHRGQHIRIAGQEPAAVGMFAVYRDTMTGELRRFPAGARGHG